MSQLKCRICHSEIDHCVVDLGLSPVANAYVSSDKLSQGEMYFPLQAYVCETCYLLQLDVFEMPEHIFRDYAYFSSYSKSWLAHCEAYCKLMKERFHLNESSKVVEIASNDGYLLQYFKALGIDVLGIEPAENVAKKARERGIETISEFFGEACARKLKEEGIKADVIVANNVLAHVPNLNGVIQGVAELLEEKGIFTAEFPHLMQLVKYNQFDTIYHEHFSYFSLNTMNYLLKQHGLRIFDVEKLNTHGGSLRIYATHEENGLEENERVVAFLKEEEALGMKTIAFYEAFQRQINTHKMTILKTLISLKAAGKTIAAYGAPAKGNTLLNFCGIGQELIDYTVDLSPHKQGLYLPGSRLPIYAPGKLMETKPDIVLILPWNLKEEISTQLQYISSWGGKLMTLIPEITIW